MATIALTQTAAWNARLTNPYRTRYATTAGRYFMVSATSLDGIWTVEEITAAGEPLGHVADIGNGLEWVYDGMPTRFAFTLAAARDIIAAAVTS